MGRQERITIPVVSLRTIHQAQTTHKSARTDSDLDPSACLARAGRPDHAQPPPGELWLRSATEPLRSTVLHQARHLAGARSVTRSRALSTRCRLFGQGQRPSALFPLAPPTRIRRLQYVAQSKCFAIRFLPRRPPPLSHAHWSFVSSYALWSLRPSPLIAAHLGGHSGFQLHPAAGLDPGPLPPAPDSDAAPNMHRPALARHQGGPSRRRHPYSRRRFAGSLPQHRMVSGGGHALPPTQAPRPPPAGASSPAG